MRGVVHHAPHILAGVDHSVHFEQSNGVCFLVAADSPRKDEEAVLDTLEKCVVELSVEELDISEPLDLDFGLTLQEEVVGVHDLDFNNIEGDLELLLLALAVVRLLVQEVLQNVDLFLRYFNEVRFFNESELPHYLIMILLESRYIFGHFSAVESALAHEVLSHIRRVPAVSLSPRLYFLVKLLHVLLEDRPLHLAQGVENGVVVSDHQHHILTQHS